MIWSGYSVIYGKLIRLIEQPLTDLLWQLKHRHRYKRLCLLRGMTQSISVARGKHINWAGKAPIE